MPSARDDARQRRVEQLANRLMELVGTGRTYQQAQKRIRRDNPEQRNWGKLLDDAEILARQKRMVAGREQATATLRENRYRREVARLEALEAARGIPAVDVELYRRAVGSNLGVPDRRVQATFIDPVTGALRTMVVYLPIPAGMSREGIAARVAAVIEATQGQTEYERLRDRYGAVVTGDLEIAPDTFARP